MKILMFGWEFPPFNSGGLGTACKGLTKGLCSQNANVTFVLPKMFGDTKSSDSNPSNVRVLFADNISYDKLKLEIVNSPLCEYINSEAYSDKIRELSRLSMNNKKCTSDSVYGKNLFEEVYRYSEQCRIIAMHEDFDIIHAHDWMTYKAGINAKKATGKPLVLHIHATEFDRTADHPNQAIYDIEREGFHFADKIIAVSNLTKNRLVQHYGVLPGKIDVVHNAVEFENAPPDCIKKNDKIVLYLGRITIQKGPEYFLYSAKRVIEKDRNVKFVVAGNGDMDGYIIQKAAELGISKNVLFTGFLRGPDIARAYRMADLYVMPSVSEPFGITPLEAMQNSTPCIISKNSGVSEVLNHCLKVDFWDIDMMSSMIISVLNYKTLHSSLQENGLREVYNFSWDIPASKCMNVYRSVLRDCGMKR